MHNFFLKKYFYINTFEPNLIKCQDKNTSIIYRNYKKENNIEEIKNIKNFCKKNKYQFFIANNVKLALKLGANGAYLPSFNKQFNHLSYSYKKKFKIIGSAHNHYEIKIKQKQKVEEIFLSSIFKKNENYLGINKFRIIKMISKSKIIALGGINKENLKRIKQINLCGFAGIEFFKKKAPKKGP